MIKMKRKQIAVAVMIACGLASPLAHATNGDEMMAVGSQNTALGGTGVANFVGAESQWANPAMLGKAKGSEVTGGVNLFKPSVANTGLPPNTVYANSTADTNYIPDVSYASRVNDSWTYGVAMAGIAGMGVDYTGANSATFIQAKSSLSILRVVADVAYNQDNFGVGFSPIFQSGSLALGYSNPNGGGLGVPVAVNAAHNKDSSTGFGFALGGYYNATKAVTLGAAYQSKISATYGTQISAAGRGFGLVGAQAFGDNLDQPAQIKLGVAFAVTDGVTLTADYKLIQWGSAAGYKDFDWQNQNIFAIGAKYAAEGYWLGLGYNHANDPIGTLPATTAGAPGTAAYRNAAINMFNNMFFPAIVTNSYTFGGGYDISKAFTLEAAGVITPQVTKTVAIASFGGTNTTTHSQKALEVSARYKF